MGGGAGAGAEVCQPSGGTGAAARKRRSAPAGPVWQRGGRRAGRRHGGGGHRDGRRGPHRRGHPGDASLRERLTGRLTGRLDGLTPGRCRRGLQIAALLHWRRFTTIQWSTFLDILLYDMPRPEAPLQQHATEQCRVHCPLTRGDQLSDPGNWRGAGIAKLQSGRHAPTPATSPKGL